MPIIVCKIRCIITLVAVLVTSAHAGCYSKGCKDLGEPILAVPQIDHNYKKDDLLYLTPRQVQVLEAIGFVLKPEENEQYPSKKEQEEEQVEKEEFDQSTEPIETENTEVQKPREILELEEILRILNQQIAANDNKKYGDYMEQLSFQRQDEGQVDYKEEERINYTREQKNGNEEEKQTIAFPRIPSRFGVLKRYITPSALSKQILQQKNTNNMAPNHITLESLQQEDNKESKTIEIHNIQEKTKTLQDIDKIDIIVDESNEQSQEEIKQKQVLVQDNLASETPLSSNDNLVLSITEYRDKLKQNEILFETGLQELKQAHQYNHQKFAFEIERLQAKLQQQNALAKAEFLEKATPFLRKRQLDATNIEVHKNNRENLLTQFISFAGSALKKLQTHVPFQLMRPIPVPVIKSSRIELKNRVPVETNNLASVTASKKVYGPINYGERVDPVEINKQLFSIGEPEESTIIRHLWEH